MQYISLFQIRKEKNLPEIYKPYYENVIVVGTKILPNETSLRFFANGHNNKSSFLSTYIEKCNEDTK